MKFSVVRKVLKIAAVLSPAGATQVLLKPVSYTDQVPIKEFKWLIVENNVGGYSGTLAQPPDHCHPDNATYPDECEWPSIRATKATAPIYSSGDYPTDELVIEHTGKYMVTVMAEGYRLCGGYFAVDDLQTRDVTVNMVCQPHPLPLGTIRMLVFKDNKPCNGQYDPGEEGLPDFGIGVNDIEGAITEDYYGNTLLDIVSDENGIIEVPNMWPGRYDIDVGPPPSEGWIKTNTLEGGHGWDYWLHEGWQGYDNEFTVGAEIFPFAMAGYTKLFNDIGDPVGNVVLNGTVETVSPWPGAYNFAEINGVVIGPSARYEGPLFNGDGVVAISDLNNNDVTVYVGTTSPTDGSFNVSLPIGDYSIAWFDISQLYILQLRTFSVTAPFDIGSMYLTGWYTEVQGFFFIDTNGDGIMDANEEGLPDGPFPVLRLRDGTQIDRGFQFEVPFKDPERKGFYNFRNGYPLASWLTMHFFHPLFEVTGYSWRTEQQNEENKRTTVLADADTDQYHISIFGTPGVTTYLDVGFRRKLENNKKEGSIYGTVHYDTTRTNLDADQAVVENHEPGIPGVTVNLYSLQKEGSCHKPCVKNVTQGFGYECPGEFEGPSKAGFEINCTRFWVGAEGEIKPHPVIMWTSTTDVTGDSNDPDSINVSVGQLVFDFNKKTNPQTSRSVITSEYEPPKDCKITDNVGNQILYEEGQSVLPTSRTGVTCVETPLLRNQVGNFAETDGSFKFSNLKPGYYAIQIEIPMDKRGTKPAYKVRTEADVNAYESDVWTGQESANPPFTKEALFIPPGVCPGSPPNDQECPMPTSDDTPRTPNRQNVKMPCAGKFIKVNSAGNPTFEANGGSYAEGEERHYCDIKIVLVEAGINSKATFHLFTDVPIPSRWRGVVLDDRLPQSNPRATLYTELKGVPHIPVGVRDFTGTQLTSVETDPNGYFEVLVPASRNNANAVKSASAIMGGMWCLTANDHGSPGHPSAALPLRDYRAIRACFEAIPGRIIPVDLAPVRITAPFLNNAGDIIDAPCGLPDEKPEFFNVHTGNNGTPDMGPICNVFPCFLEIRGRNLCVSSNLPTVRLSHPTKNVTTLVVDSCENHNGALLPVPYDSVNINITDPGSDQYGMYQLELVNDSREELLTGISIHLLRESYYNPIIYNATDGIFNPTVEKGRIQIAIDTWEDASDADHSRGAIILIPPNEYNADDNLEAAHVENLIISRPVKLQGFGPGGGNQADEFTRGTQLDGGGFGANTGTSCPNNADLFCDGPRQVAWQANVKSKTFGKDIGNNALVEGQVLYVLGNKEDYNGGPTSKGWTEALRGGVDGCLITGGSQQGGILANQLMNVPTAAFPEFPEVVAVQGGGVTLHSYTKYFRITNNEIRANSGSFAGAIRVGTAFLDNKSGLGNSHNTDLTISRNRILYNGGFNLAGAIGIFGGSDRYVIQKNQICGNSGQEYGGGICHFGTSDDGTISDNWIMWNRAVDEGGGIMIGSETISLAGINEGNDPANAGPVTISGNTIQGCLSGDDGGGIRFLNPGLSVYTVVDNVISHNVAMHEGGGVSINDAPFVTFTGNTVVSNIVTGTSLESTNSELYAAGLATHALGRTVTQKLNGITYDWTFSHPQNFTNNVFWDNRASNGEIVNVAGKNELQGLGMSDATPTTNLWLFDMGSSTSIDGQLVPTSSTIQTLGKYYGGCPEEISPLYLSRFLTSPPFVCQSSLNMFGVSSTVNWGEHLKVKVLGLAVTLAGSNTFVVDAGAALPNGPIGIVVNTARRRDLYEYAALAGSEQKPSIRAHHKAKELGRNRKLSLQVDSRGRPSLFWSILVVAALFILLSARAVREKVRKSDDEVVSENQKETQQAPVTEMNRRSALRRFFMALMLALGCSKDAAADADCTLDCMGAYTPIPTQVKYETELFIPDVLDLRGPSCGQQVDIYMLRGTQDWGVKNAGGSLSTPIYGYSLNATGPPSFPGPTIITTKNCPVSVTFHNKLGIGRHMFEIDRSVFCGSESVMLDSVCTALDTTAYPFQPPADDPNFYCRCAAPHGSERRTTTHLHGGHTVARYDGHPESWYTDHFALDGVEVRDGGHRFDETGVNFSNGTNEYPNDQPACTLFYHDHAHGITRLNVYAGLAALYIIEDDVKTAAFASLRLGDLLGDVPLAFSDRIFRLDESDLNSAPSVFPHGVTDADGGGLPAFSILPEMFGDVMTVNGRIYPFYDVTPNGYYHFRLLNACDSRFLRLYFETSEGRLNFVVVASDQGLLEDLADVDEILMGPAERYEIIISFHGATGPVTLMNSEITLLGPVVPGVDDQFMQFRVAGSTVDFTPSITPGAWNATNERVFQKLIEISQPVVVNDNILDDYIGKRELWITEATQVQALADTSTGGRPLPMLGDRQTPFGLLYNQAITERLIQNKPFIWELINLSADAHVIHLHQIRFKILDRQAVGLSYNTFQYPTGFYRQYPKDSEEPASYETGPKDTVISFPGSVTRIIMIFDIAGTYVWHCHILSHEDNMMMREFIIESEIPSTAYFNAAAGRSGKTPPGQI